MVALVAAACGNEQRRGVAAAARRPPKTYSSIGAGEGELNLIAWNGYVEDGSNDPNYDWVTPFETADGLQGHGEVRRHLRRDGHPDAPGRRLRLRRRLGVRATPSNRLIAGGDVAAIDTDAVPASITNVIAPLQPVGGTNNPTTW